MKPFTINIPIYNEEEILARNIETLIPLLSRSAGEYEIIIVSNGSTDQSDRLGKQLAAKYPQLRFYSLPQKGVGRAFRKAVKEASYEHIISLDIDLSIDLAFLKQASSLLEEHCLVIGSKIAGTQKRSLVRKIGSGIYIYLSRFLLGINLHDFSIGAKGFQRSFVLKNLDCVDDYTSYVLNLAAAAKKTNKKIIEIPVHCEDFRESKFNLMAEAIYRFAMLFKLAIAFWQRPRSSI